ncbi:MAG: hypothetical protein LAT76_03300 [Schleiferiaceae bacterium]|nr:hypothetical protein [Schleiferiaceae bacterium]
MIYHKPHQKELRGYCTEEVEVYPSATAEGMTTLDHINCLCRNGENAFVWQNYGVSCHNFE